MNLWVPRSDHDREVTEQVQVVREWNPILKRLDPDLQLVWAPDNVTAAGLTPGRYHVLRTPPFGPPLLLAVETEDGGFRVPDSGLLEQLARDDMWSDRSRKERRKLQAQAEQQAERQRRFERQERVDEINERVASAKRTSVVVP